MFTGQVSEMNVISYNWVKTMRFWSLPISFLFIVNTLSPKCVLGAITASRHSVASHAVETECPREIRELGYTETGQVESLRLPELDPVGEIMRELGYTTTGQAESLRLPEIHPVQEIVKPSLKQTEQLSWRMSREDDSSNPIGEIKPVAPLASLNQDDASLIDSIADAVELSRGINFEEIASWRDGTRLRKILLGIADTQVEMTDKYGSYSNVVKQHLKKKLLKDNQVMSQLLEGIWDSFAKWAYAHSSALDNTQFQTVRMYIESIKSYNIAQENDEWGEGTSKRSKIASDVVRALDEQNLFGDTDVGKDLAAAEKAMLNKLNKLKLDRTIECSYVRDGLEKIQRVLKRSGLLNISKADYSVEQYEQAKAIRSLRSEIIQSIERQNMYIFHKSKKDLQHLNFGQPQWNLNMEVLEIEKMSKSIGKLASDALEHFGQLNWHRIRDEVQRVSKKGNPGNPRAKLVWQSGKIIKRLSLPKAQPKNSGQRCTCKKDMRLPVHLLD